ncbi:DUF4321 domain-containing protein [Paenibacillus humicola]|uniref:DUF4321 domain-containing protein n=1 Tax=Paenibacillus humicola TaxID=3110540 RepID=UPI00237C43A1|nr:DUF4321 domain-containing protein [Paenibacillus humicola]
MKKNAWLLPLFIIIGLVAGALASHWLKPVRALSFLTHSEKVDWTPSADLLVVSYSLKVHIELSLLSIIGLLAAIWLYRKM